MALNVQGLLSGLAGLPNAIGQGLLGPMSVNSQLGLDPQSLSQARSQSLNDLAMGLMAGNRQNPGGTLMGATQNARQGFQGRVFDMLKEQELLRMRDMRSKQETAAGNIATQSGDPLLAQLAAANPSGVIDQATQMAFAPGADGRTDDIKEYERAVQQGFTGTLQDWILLQKRAGATSVSVNTNLPPQENELAKALGKGAGEEFVGLSTTARSAVSTLEQLNQLVPLVNSPGFISGPLGASRLAVAKVLGLQGADETQAYFAGVGRQVGENIKMFGAGTGLSDADREFAKNIAAGNIELTPSAIKKIIGINRKVSETVIRNYNQRRTELAQPKGGPARPEVYGLFPSLTAPSGGGVDALLDKYAPKP
jgi:hypothetical protein